ncbi:uncharacterized protein LOC110500942 [Oncorhynchus mykiss]|uniref:uncharacterized protein LOC110500942 n=1 Tax=Oncorhynchus mykiss TaxID=8022 RepID=UPI001877FA65|nr:uncharacterized protein LOC110500942 [Oncorhynchus mykiss]XP_036813878.1 uncharacterized protein LOC110500942 [Oncorhynchus mykiss]
MGRCIEVCKLVLWVAVCVTFIVMGAVYADDCPVKRVIPIHMIISGSFGLLYVFFSCCKDRVVCQHLSKLFWFMIIIWLIIGHFWTFSVFQPNYARKEIIGNTVYCNKSLYLFVASTTIILDIIICMWLLVLFDVCPCFILCLVCCVSLCKSDDGKPVQVVEPLTVVETEDCVEPKECVWTEVCMGIEVCVETQESVGHDESVKHEESVEYVESMEYKEYVVTGQSESNTAHY